MTIQRAASSFSLWCHKDTGSPSFLLSWVQGWMPWSRRQSLQFWLPSIQSHFPWPLLILDPASGWTQQIQDENRPLAEKAGFPQSALSPNGQSKCCWLGLKASEPLPTSAGQHQGGPVSTVHGQVCYFIPCHSANIRLPFMNLNNQTELKSALASRKMSKIPHWPQLLRVRDSAKPSPLLSWASQACPVPQATFWSLSV